MLQIAFALQLTQMLDSTLESTRRFWRAEFYGATEAEQRDPRPWAEVLAERMVNLRASHDCS
jgi:hypothetical protein